MSDCLPRIESPQPQERALTRKDTPLDYLIVYAICFAAGAVSTMLAAAYARYAQR